VDSQLKELQGACGINDLSAAPADSPSPQQPPPPALQQSSPLQQGSLLASTEQRLTEGELKDALDVIKTFNDSQDFREVPNVEETVKKLTSKSVEFQILKASYRLRLKGWNALLNNLSKKRDADSEGVQALRSLAESLRARWQAMGREKPKKCAKPELSPNGASESSLKLRLTKPVSATNVTGMTVEYTMKPLGEEKNRAAAKKEASPIGLDVLNGKLVGELFEWELSGLMEGRTYEIGVKAIGSTACWQEAGQVSEKLTASTMSTMTPNELKQSTNELVKLEKRLTDASKGNDDAAVQNACGQALFCLEKLWTKRVTVEDLKTKVIGHTTLRTPVNKLCKKEGTTLDALAKEAQKLSSQWKCLGKKPPAACVTPELASGGASESTLRVHVEVPPSATPVTALHVECKKKEDDSRPLEKLYPPQQDAWQQGSTVTCELTDLEPGSWYDIRARAVGTESLCWAKAEGRFSKFPLRATTIHEASIEKLREKDKILTGFLDVLSDLPDPNTVAPKASETVLETLQNLRQMKVTVSLLRTSCVRTSTAKLKEVLQNLQFADGSNLRQLLDEAESLSQFWSSMIKKSPTRCAKPQLRGASLNTLSLEVTVPQSETQITGFIVEYSLEGKCKFKPHPVDESSWKALGPGDTFSVELPGLEKGTPYDIRVKAVTQVEAVVSGLQPDALMAEDKLADVPMTEARPHDATPSLAAESTKLTDSPGKPAPRKKPHPPQPALSQPTALAASAAPAAPIAPAASDEESFEAVFDDDVSLEATDEGSSESPSKIVPAHAGSESLPGQQLKETKDDVKQKISDQLSKAFGESMPEFKNSVCSLATEKAWTLLQNETDPDLLEMMRQASWLAKQIALAQQEMLTTMSTTEKRKQLKDLHAKKQDEADVQEDPDTTKELQKKLQLSSELQKKLQLDSKPASSGGPSPSWEKLSTSKVKHDLWVDEKKTMYPGLKGFNKFAQAHLCSVALLNCTFLRNQL
jgi:hypothetical protein